MTSEDFDKVYHLVMTGQTGPALKIIDTALKQDPNEIAVQLLRIKTLRMAANYRAAKADIARFSSMIAAVGSSTAKAELAFERGFVLQKAGQLNQALDCFLEAERIGDAKVDYYCAICSTLCHLNRDGEAAAWRNKILRMRDAAVDCAPDAVITAGRPKPFDATLPRRNIVSYSLFGSDPYYHECAVTNARITSVMFPEFTARFYCAPDLPMQVLKALKAAGAELLRPRRPASASMSPMAGTFWRFLAFDDPDVDVVLCRDVDSPILPRERAAIELWLASSAPFYCLRDHSVHAELLLAGMWGGFTRVLPPLGPLADRFARTDHSRFADQSFLRQVVWPRVRDNAILVIDSIPSLDGSVDFPEGYPKHGRQHVGMSWTRKQILG